MSTKEAPVYKHPERVSRVGLYLVGWQSWDSVTQICWNTTYPTLEAAQAQVKEMEKRNKDADAGSLPTNNIVFRVEQVTPCRPTEGE